MNTHPQFKLLQQSKYLSYLLRHKPEAASLDLDKEGWCSVEQVIEQTGITLQELQTIVASDDKQRYSFSPDGTKIRANQGHSSKQVSLTFQKAIPPTVLYHGTSAKSLSPIMKQGLLPMNRQFVHLSDKLEVAQSVAGRRKGDTTILTIDTKKMVTDGVRFYLSVNGVWLTDFVHPKYITAS